MLAAVLLAVVVGTVVAFGASFAPRVEPEAVAAISTPAGATFTPNAKRQPYLAIDRKTASLLLYSVLRSGGGH